MSIEPKGSMYRRIRPWVLGTRNSNMIMMYLDPQGKQDQGVGRRV